MVMSFPNSGNNGRPWARLDARTGIMFLSSADGEKTSCDLKGKVLALDIANATQGWLAVTAAGAAWSPIEDGVWGGAPTEDHKPGVDIDIWCKDFGDVKLRTSRGNSRGWNNFIQAVAEKAGEVGGDSWPTIKITAVKVVKVGQGTSIDVEFLMAPPEKWVKETAIRADDDEAPAPAKPAPAKPKPAPTTVDDLDDDF